MSSVMNRFPTLPPPRDAANFKHNVRANYKGVKCYNTQKKLREQTTENFRNYLWGKMKKKTIINVRFDVTLGTS